ncbi:MAG TPA: Fe-S cluster assembly protein SufD [Pyrinomonadaceae bacterium]|nr:Fe-S cluster assembly protein SufD [Pyrinomonadaceae bacterium]
MTQATLERSTYRAAWETARGRGGRALPSWAARLSEGAFEVFEREGFPVTTQEDWKYTNVAPIARASFEPAARDGGTVGVEALKVRLFPESSRTTAVFANGHFRPELSSLAGLPEGVIVADMSAAITEHEPLLREHLSRAADFSRNSFTALNTAFLGAGILIHLPAGAQLSAPLHLLFVASKSDAQLLVSPRVLVVAEADSSATVVEDYESADGSSHLTNAVVEVFVKERARVVHYKRQAEGDAAFHVAATHAELAAGSSYDLTTITQGARLSRHEISVRLLAEGAECWVDGLYIAGAGQHADTHSTIDHVAPRCASHQLYKGILDGDGRAVFNGRVFVRRDAQQTDARQTNKNLLLSPDARVDTKPQLEIFADDVKCSHGATVGQLEEEELFYLLSRGLHPELARNLLTYGFAEELVEKIKIDSIKRRLDEAILNRLHARLEA